jgi:hypothetical protein
VLRRLVALTTTLPRILSLNPVLLWPVATPTTLPQPPTNSVLRRLALTTTLPRSPLNLVLCWPVAPPMTLPRPAINSVL